jgi:uracil-DNA glycosylase
LNRSDAAYLKEIGLWPRWRSRAAQERATPALGAQPAPGQYGSAQAPAPRRDTADSSHTERREQILQMDWPQLKASVAGCNACPLHAGRKQTVFGVGDEKADWLFIGEGPGAEEDARGEPFVGQAGKLLDNMLAALGLKRGENVYIANIVKCRPPNNRNPEPSEAARCEPYLTRQIELIRPKLIVALGKVAAANLLATDAPIGALRGKLHNHRGIPLIATYHPAYLLRTLADKAKAWQDLVFARRCLAESLRKSR